MFPEEWKTEIIEIGHLPFYNQDFDDHNQAPEEVIKFPQKLKDFDAFLFVTPEYNRSSPTVLKNVIDIGSLLKSGNVWSKKTRVVISQLPGNIGGFGANHHLRQTLMTINMPVVQQPEVYISNVADLMDEEGKLTNKIILQ